jgi:hypothetical protein
MLSLSLGSPIFLGGSHFFYHIAKANLAPASQYTYVEIDNQDFGLLQEGFHLAPTTAHSEKPVFELKRNFVVDKSLTLWAKNTAKKNTAANIFLVTKNEFGKEIAKYELRGVKPLSWSVETNRQSSGGFYERVDLFAEEVIFH